MNFPFFKYILLTVVIGWFWDSNAQTILYKSDIRSESQRSNYSDIFPFYNSKNKETALFLEDGLSKSIDLLVLDENGKEKEIIRGRNPKLRIPEFIGAMYADNIYTSYFFDKGNFILGTTSFNLGTGTSISETISLKLKRGEKVITQFHYNNLFYFVILQKETSNVSFHIYKNNTFLEKKTIELNNADFPHFLRDNLYNCVAYNKGKYKSVDLFNPLYADQVSDYFLKQNTSFYMVVNTHKVVKIDLETFNTKVIDFPINYSEANESYKKSVLKNIIKKTKSKSTIYDDLFFRVSIVKDVIRLQVYRINDGEELLNTVIEDDQINAQTIYNSAFRRDVNYKTKEALLFRALHTGEFGFRVVKNGETYKIHLGKVATNEFWDVFDQSSNQEASERNARLGFTTKFVGIFSDYKGDEFKSYLLSPAFAKEGIQSRYLEFTFNKTKGILPVTEQDKENASNPFTLFIDSIHKPIYQPRLNGFFRRSGDFHYISYDPIVSELFLYKL